MTPRPARAWQDRLDAVAVEASLLAPVVLIACALTLAAVLAPVTLPFALLRSRNP